MTLEQRPDDSRSVLAELPGDHPYRAVLDSAFPRASGQSAAWREARPLVLEILAADVGSPVFSIDAAAHRRGALCRYLTWLADDDAGLLEVELALSDDEIQRYLATEAMARRSTHRSRVALRSVLRSFRADYPVSCFPIRALLTAGQDPILTPVEDWEVDLALRTASVFRNPATRKHARAVILLGRGAGADGADLRYVTGADVTKVPSAGTWVHLGPPGRSRRVPVLARFATDLEDLALDRPERLLVVDRVPPAPSNAASVMTRLVNRAMSRGGHPQVRISPERLRKAWLAEHLAANTPLNTLLAAAGLSSLRTLETLVATHAPVAPERPEHLAYELGGVVRHRGS